MTAQSKGESSEPAEVVKALQTKFSKGQMAGIGGTVATMFLAAAGWAMNTAGNILNGMAEMRASIKSVESAVTDTKTDTKSAMGRLEKRMDRLEDRFFDSGHSPRNNARTEKPDETDGG